MEKIIYFKENENQHGVLRFVKSYRKKGFLRRERIEYTLSYGSSHVFVDNDAIGMVVERIKKDYPKAKIYENDCEHFPKDYRTHLFWVIAHLDKNNKIDGYYSGKNDGKYATYTDLDDAEIGFDMRSTEETLNMIRRLTGEKYYVQPIYMDLVNGLLEPNFMITCTSKRGSQETKYFKRIEEGRLRLVKTSDCAMKFTYEEVLRMFDYLLGYNKNFLYSVFPVFPDNVNYKNLENYVRENKVSRMVQMTTKIRWMNR